MPMSDNRGCFRYLPRGAADLATGRRAASSRSNRPAGARLVSPAVRAPRHLARPTPPSTGPGAASRSQGGQNQSQTFTGGVPLAVIVADVSGYGDLVTVMRR